MMTLMMTTVMTGMPDNKITLYFFLPAAEHLSHIISCILDCSVCQVGAWVSLYAFFRETGIFQQITGNSMTTLCTDSVLTCCTQYLLFSQIWPIHFSTWHHWLIIQILSLISRILFCNVWESVFLILFSNSPWEFLASGGFGKFCLFKTQGNPEGRLGRVDFGDIQIL